MAIIKTYRNGNTVVHIDDSAMQHGEELEKTLDAIATTITKILVNGIKRGDEKIIQYIKDHSISEEYIGKDPRYRVYCK